MDLNKFESGQAVFDRWLEEAEGGAELERVGVIQNNWKDVSEPTMYNVVKIQAENVLQAHATVLEELQGDPLGRDGALIIDEIREVRPYAEWR